MRGNSYCIPSGYFSLHSLEGPRWSFLQQWACKSFCMHNCFLRSKQLILVKSEWNLGNLEVFYLPNLAKFGIYTFDIEGKT